MDGGDGDATRPARRRHARWFDLLASVVIGVAVVGAALIPAVTANSGGTTTLRGDVTMNGAPVAFFPVGFWTTAGTVYRGQTDASGGFTIAVPETVDGYAFAGSRPDSAHAITTVDGTAVVRGVLGASATKGTTSPLYQGWGVATARSIAGGASLVHFRLQRAGTVTGTSPVAASSLRAVQVRRLDGSVIQTMRVDSRGRYTSESLVPGSYAVVVVPKLPGLPSVAAVTVRAGRATTVSVARPETGATVSGVVRASDGALGAGIPVLLEQDGDVLQSTTTSSSGGWSFAGVAAGDFTVEVGRFDTASATSASAVGVTIPGATSTPTPSPSTATPTPSATTAQGAAIEAVPSTSDTVQRSTFSITVPTVLGDVGLDTVVERAGRISGTVSRDEAITGTETAPVRIVVEEAATGRIVRAAKADTSGAYSVGGLVPGQRYQVWAVTEPSDATLTQMGETTAVARVTAPRADISIDRQAVTVNGTVTDATAGTVTAGSSGLFSRSGSIDSSGAYALQGLVPGAYPVVVTTKDHIASTPTGVVVSAGSPVVNLQQGPRPATFRAWFIASGAGVPLVIGTARDDDGDLVRFRGETDGGHVTVTGLAPGTYAYESDSFLGTVPALDGPWFYLAPTGTFSLSDGAGPDMGPVLLHVRAR